MALMYLPGVDVVDVAPSVVVGFDDARAELDALALSSWEATQASEDVYSPSLHDRAVERVACLG